MNQLIRLASATTMVGLALLFTMTLAAQDPATSSSARDSGDAESELTVAQTEVALASIEADAGIEDAVKDVLRPKYKQAIEALSLAADFAVKTNDFMKAINTAPTREEDLRYELNGLLSVEDAASVTARGSIEELQRDIDARRAKLSGLSNELSQVTRALAAAKGRPAEISSRLPEAERDLADVRKDLASPELAQDVTSPGRVADRLVLRAREKSLLNELEMLKQEQLTQAVREELLEAQEELQTRQVENAEAALNTLKVLLHPRLTKQAREIRARVDAAFKDVPQGDQAARALAEEVQALAKQFDELVENFKKVTAAQADITTRFKRLTDEYQGVQDQLKLGSREGAMSQLLINFDRRVITASAGVSKTQLPTLEKTQLASLQIDAQREDQSNLEKQFADHVSDAVTQLVAVRRDVLDKLRTQYGSLTRALASYEGNRRLFLDKSDEISSFIRKQLFWMQSSPPISLKTFTDIPHGFRWELWREHWFEIGRSVRWTVTRKPLRSTMIGLAMILLVLLRHRIRKSLERTGEQVRRISTDRYSHTAEALVWTTLLAMPIPLSIGFVAWSLQQPPSASEWQQDVAGGLWTAGWIVFSAAFLIVVCRPRGLGAAHFGWIKETLAPMRRAIRLFTLVYVPSLVLTASYYLFGDSPYHIDSVGRIGFMLAHVWMAIVLWQLFQSSDGLFATLIREHPGSLITRWRFAWFAVILACPFSLLVLASLGYLITSVELSVGFLGTVILIASGQILYSLALRWFMISHRKLALAEAIERRRARQEAADSDEEQRESEEVVLVDVEEEVLDLESIGAQTRALLRMLFGLGVAVTILLFWSGSFPLIEVFRETPIPLVPLSLLQLFQALIIVVATFIAARNLPGLLELAMLRTMTIDVGTRNAVVTLCQYAVSAIGIALLLNVLHVDWAKFGWVAAALSVGLGFGMQEVVANFVCGLILLFERPIRVGDIVTVEGTTGTVTKIHLRATTITNWDRQDFVVPNKTLITGTLLNWTLSAATTRVVIPVGVAYGTDTAKACQILLNVAADHPLVLEEPSPMASFEAFADSSLNLVLRAYLPDLDNRLGTISDLHTEIDKRFAEAGIEISFPQRDLHLRSGWNALLPTSAEDGNQTAPAPENSSGH